MPDVRKGVNRPAGTPTGHAHHDRVLVSRYASDDAYEGELEQARRLVELCPDCAALAADIRTLSASLAVSHAPPRQRDFRITAEQANKLHGSRFDRLFRRLAAPSLAPARPLAGVALSLGLALAVAGAALPTPTVNDMAFEQMGGQPAAGDPRSEVEPPAEHAPDRPAAQPQVTDGTAYGPSEERVVELQAEDLPGAIIDQEATTTRNLLVFGGLGLALLSLGTLALIVLARRRIHDPLLR